MLFIQSLVLIASFLAVGVLAVPVPLNGGVLILARAPSLNDEVGQMLVARNKESAPRLTVKLPDPRISWRPPMKPPTSQSPPPTPISRGPVIRKDSSFKGFDTLPVHPVEHSHKK
ncbi:hypothetical protein BYT27DRAFT_6966232 [Phlegmacium glaucopus]|nr:hypothetical protein BYT27DRAFT_6966232 [Phlegmacium glaucopus]